MSFVIKMCHCHGCDTVHWLWQVLFRRLESRLALLCGCDENGPVSVRKKKKESTTKSFHRRLACVLFSYHVVQNPHQLPGYRVLCQMWIWNNRHFLYLDPWSMSIHVWYCAYFSHCYPIKLQIVLKFYVPILFLMYLFCTILFFFWNCLPL